MDVDAELEPRRFVGRAPEQTDEFLAEHIRPILAANPDLLGAEADIEV
jgi:adenylosuccinate lyase